jgi:hypothetical protein
VRSDAGRSSMHTLAEIAEGPGLLQRELLHEERLASSAAALKTLPEFTSSLALFRNGCRVSTRDMLQAIAGDHDCCQRLRATVVRLDSGAVRCLKIAQ